MAMNKHLPIYSANYKIYDLDTSSTEKRYRVVSETCDIEISGNVKYLLEFIKLHEGKTSSFIIDKFCLENSSNKESVENTLLVLFKKGILCKDKNEQREIKEENYFRNKMEYLWFRIKLIDTEKYKLFFKSLAFVFSKAFIFSIISLFIIFDSVFIILYFFTSWSKQLIYYSTIDYLVLGFVGSFIMVLLHETGHIVAATKYGAKTGGIGVGIYYYYFVAYADVHETWNLPRNQRKVVSIAGFYWNTIFILPLFLICFLTRSKASADCILLFHFAFISVFNPFLKMDGYWFLCDVLGVPNLQTRISTYLYQYLPAKLFNKSNQNNPFISYPEKIRRGIRIYLVFFIFFMVFFLSFFLYRAIGITINMETEIINPAKFLIDNWRQGLSELTNHINLLLRNGFILLGAIMLLLSYFVKMIKYIISKLKR